MNDDARLERLFADGLTELAPSRAPGRLRTDVTQATARVRPRPRWLAVMKEPPMRISATLAVGSPTARVAGLVAATFLLIAAVAGAGLAGSRLLAADGTLVVDQAGDGDYTTIGDAIAAAQDGDTILVKPGRYVEHVIIANKDVTISGDGDPELVVLVATGSDPILELNESDATVSGLTLTGPESHVVVQGGSPTLTDLAFIDVGGSSGDGSLLFDGLIVGNRSTASITGNRFTGGGGISAIGNAAPVIENNDLRDGPTISLKSIGDGTIVRGNRIYGAGWTAIGLYGPGKPLIAGNDIKDEGGIEIGDAGYSAIEIGEAGYYAFGTDPIVRANSIAGAPIGIEIAEGAAPVVDANQIKATEFGLAFGGPGSAGMTGNRICGAKAAVSVPDGMVAPGLDGNTLCEVSG